VSAKPDPRPAPGTLLCRLDELADPGSRAFAWGEFGNEFRMFVVRKGALVRAYVNECPHARHPLDWNLGQVFDPSRELLVCASHGAKFRPEDGVCVEGPCLGKSLMPVEIDVGDKTVRLATPMRRRLEHLLVESDSRVSDRTALTLRLARPMDAQTTFAWQSDPSTRLHMRNPEKPNWEEHRAWFALLLADPRRALLIAEYGNTPVGSIRLDPQVLAGAGAAFEVSIVTAPSHRNKGIGGTILRLTRELVPDVVLVAFVKPENAASLKIFAVNGYVPADKDGHLVNWPGSGH